MDLELRKKRGKFFGGGRWGAREGAAAILRGERIKVERAETPGAQTIDGTRREGCAATRTGGNGVAFAHK
jgi:hypothetical protein